MRQKFDPCSCLVEHAEHLNSICVPDKHAIPNYDVLGDAIIWSDETRRDTPKEVKSALRLIFYHRTQLLLSETDFRFQEIWDLGLKHFSNWIGFLPSRREPTETLLAYCQRRREETEKELELIQTEMDIENGIKECQ